MAFWATCKIAQPIQPIWQHTHIIRKSLRLYYTSYGQIWILIAVWSMPEPVLVTWHAFYKITTLLKKMKVQNKWPRIMSKQNWALLENANFDFRSDYIFWNSCRSKWRCSCSASVVITNQKFFLQPDLFLYNSNKKKQKLKGISMIWSGNMQLACDRDRQLHSEPNL